MQKEEKKMRQKDVELPKKMFSFIFVTDHANVRFFFFISLRTYSQSLNDGNICTALSDSFCTTCCIFSAQIASQLSQVHFFFFLNMWIFKNQPPRRVSCNVNLSNLGNVLERNLRTKSARECIFRASGSTNFETFTARRQLW